MVDVADLKDDDYIPDSLRATTQQFINILQKILKKIKILLFILVKIYVWKDFLLLLLYLVVW